LNGAPQNSASPDYIILAYPISNPQARLAYAQQIGNQSIVKFTQAYFSTAGSMEDGNPQRLLEGCNPGKLPPALLLQGGADEKGVVADQNISPAIQQCFADAYRSAGGQIQLELLPSAPHNFVNANGVNLDFALTLIMTFIRQQFGAHAEVIE
jgi:acetyl esterase/lipase